MTRNEIVEAITQRLSEVIPDIAPTDLTEELDLLGVPDFDSLGILESLVWLEGKFDLTIPDERLVVESFSSIGKMADYVVESRAGTSA